MWEITDSAIASDFDTSIALILYMDECEKEAAREKRQLDMFASIFGVKTEPDPEVYW